MNEQLISFIYQLVSKVVEPLYYFMEPGKRIFWLYLISSILVVVFYYWRRKQQLTFWLKKSLRSRYWFNRSGLVDLKWVAVNQVFAFLVLLPLLVGQVAWALATYRILQDWFGLGDFLNWPKLTVMVLFTVIVFICEDFSRFFVHYCYHKIPLLWRFHAIHHSARVMTPLTLYRIHFVEYAINSLRSLVVTGTVSGIFIYCFVGKVGLYEVLGVSVFNLLFNLLGANLRHSHIWISFGRFEKYFVSPAQHQIHHSSARAHLDKNMGASLAIWDRLFGTWLASDKQQVARYGLYKQPSRQTISSQLLGISSKN